MSRIRIIQWSVAVMGFFCLVLPVKAQVDTGTILGTVHDASGAVVPGAKVTVSNEGTAFTETTTTSGSGTYVFTPLRIGTYTVEVEQPGFKKQRKTGQELNIQQQLVVDFALAPGEVTTTVDVTGSGARSADRKRFRGTGGGSQVD